jgi:hypothetical protein
LEELACCNHERTSDAGASDEMNPRKRRKRRSKNAT